MKIAVTGHRPDKLGGYQFSTRKRIWVRDRLRDRLVQYKPNLCISGMALGVDQDFAYVAVEMGIPFLAAVPFQGQETKWPADAQRFYLELLNLASEVVIVSPGGYAVEKMQVRNRWMVDNCDLLLAVWDGSPGGTGNCVRYATSVGKTMDRIDPNAQEA